MNDRAPNPKPVTPEPIAEQMTNPTPVVEDPTDTTEAPEATEATESTEEKEMTRAEIEAEIAKLIDSINEDIGQFGASVEVASQSDDGKIDTLYFSLDGDRIIEGGTKIIELAVNTFRMGAERGRIVGLAAGQVAQKMVIGGIEPAAFAEIAEILSGTESEANESNDSE